jgi:hypothetical protein
MRRNGSSPGSWGSAPTAADESHFAAAGHAPAAPQPQPPNVASGSRSTLGDGISPELVRSWMLAAKNGDVAELGRLLGASPALLCVKGPGLGHTALHWCASRGHIQSLRFLLQRGAPPGARNAEGSTPLHAAARNGHVEVARVLLACGASADLQAIDSDGYTALQLAMMYDFTPLVQLLLGGCSSDGGGAVNAANAAIASQAAAQTAAGMSAATSTSSAAAQQQQQVPAAGSVPAFASHDSVPGSVGSSGRDDSKGERDAPPGAPHPVRAAASAAAASGVSLSHQQHTQPPHYPSPCKQQQEVNVGKAVPGARGAAGPKSGPAKPGSAAADERAQRRAALQAEQAEAEARDAARCVLD